jgi:hypothetical protein
LEKKVMDNTGKIEDLQSLINYLQKMFSDNKDKPTGKIDIPVMSSGIDNDALNSLRNEIENLKR